MNVSDGYDFKCFYTYDENNNITEELYQYWADSNWVNGSRHFYTYDENNNITEKLYQYWVDSNWVNSQRYSYTYDENQNQTEELWQHWSDSNWVNDYKYSYTYDENQNQTESLFQTWDGSAWVNSEKYSYKYLSVTKINEDLSLIYSYSLLNNYPNPFNPTTKINYSIPKRSNVVIKVYDILGNEIETLVKEEKPTGNYEIKFDGANLSSGIYFYQLRADSFVKTKKMILLK